MTSKIFLIYLKYQCVITVYNPRGYCKKTVNGTQRNEVRKRYDFKNSKITKEKTLYEWKVNDDIYNLHSHRSKWKCGTRISILMELEKNMYQVPLDNARTICKGNYFHLTNSISFSFLPEPSNVFTNEICCASRN